MRKWHLYETFENGLNTGGRVQFIWLFGITGVFILLLACINFMNSEALPVLKNGRRKGIRKAVGSMRGQLVMQFFGESVLMAAIALLCSLLPVQLLLPAFNHMAGKR